MKRVLFFIIIFGAAFTLQAQSRFGVTAGLKVSDSVNTNLNIGIQYGVTEKLKTYAEVLGFLQPGAFERTPEFVGYHHSEKYKGVASISRKNNFASGIRIGFSCELWKRKYYAISIGLIGFYSRLSYSTSQYYAFLTPDGISQGINKYALSAVSNLKSNVNISNSGSTFFLRFQIPVFHHWDAFMQMESSWVKGTINRKTSTILESYDALTDTYLTGKTLHVTAVTQSSVIQGFGFPRFGLVWYPGKKEKP